MERGMEESGAFGTERGRRPSDVPNAPEAAGLAGVPVPAVDDPTAGSAAPESPGPELASAVPTREVNGVPAVDITDLAEGAAWSVPEPGPERSPRLGGTTRGRQLEKPPAAEGPRLTPEQRLLMLDTWRRSGLPAGDFAPLVGVSRDTLYAWKRRFEHYGPGGLMDKAPGGGRGSRLPEVTRRTILMLKESNPEWGCQRISDMLVRGPALPASPAAVGRVLKEAGYTCEETPTRAHEEPVQRFERARPNQLWQTDLFTFVLKRQNRRVYLVAFMDDASRFVVSYGLHASQSSALVLEVLRAGIASYRTPEEILTDNGAQYVTWRGKSAFTKVLQQQGIRHLVARPRRPQTLGKVERFWGTLWRECLEMAVFIDLGDAQRRLGHFIDHYNFQRPHQGIEGLVPADRYFEAAPEVLATLKARVAHNALELARQGVPKPPFYLTGQVGGQPFSVHAEGERVILTRAGGSREEVALTAPPGAAPPGAESAAAASLDAGSSPASAVPAPVCPQGVVESLPGSEGSEAPCPPGVSPLDDGLRRMSDGNGIDTQDEERTHGDHSGAERADSDDESE